MNTDLNFNAVGLIYLSLCGLCCFSPLVSEIVNPPVVSRIMAPKEHHVRIPKACGFVVLRGKGELRLHMELSC